MANELVKLINDILKEYKNEDGIADRKMISKYSIGSDILKQIYNDEYKSMETKVGIGAGSMAKCPYIIFMDSQITHSPTVGIYVVLIFKENMSGFYLMLNQGVTFLQYSDEEFGRIRKFWCDRLGEDAKKQKIELASKPTKLILDYQRAYIKADEFDKSFDSEIFMKKLEQYLHHYKKIAEIIKDEFQNDIETMYQKITDKEESNAALGVAQLKESKLAKKKEVLLDEFVRDLNNDIEKTRGVVFFLGAGVSCALGLPDWNTLVFNLLQKRWDFQMPNVPESEVKEYVKHYSSPTTLAAMIKNQYQEDSQFIESIHNIFYEKEVDQNTLLNSPIGKIARKITKRSTNTKAVITYNFDNFLEKAMGLIDCSNEYEVIHAANENKVYQGNKLPIYHIHGYIPQENYKEIGTSIVFTEKEYHELYSDFYNWTNIVQTKYLMDYTCIFLGLSFSDPNQRRILENVCPFIPNGRFNYLIVGNTMPSGEALQQCDNELNLLNSSWNEKNYKLKTYYINGNSYDEVNSLIVEILERLV